MTTTVKIEAHCASNKRVIVQVTGSDGGVGLRELADGESTIEYAYDDRAVSVREIVVAQPEQPDDPATTPA